MAFVFSALAAVSWSLIVIRWSRSRRGRGAIAVLLLSIAVVCAGTASLVSDLRGLQLGRKAKPSDLVVRVIRRGDWYQLDYQRNRSSFTTANEIHLPAGAVVTMVWFDLPAPWIEGSICLPRADQQCALLTGEARNADALFVRLWTPMALRMRVIVEPPGEFERWFENERLPVRSAEGRAALLFNSASCGY